MELVLIHEFAEKRYEFLRTGQPQLLLVKYVVEMVDALAGHPNQADGPGIEARFCRIDGPASASPPSFFRLFEGRSHSPQISIEYDWGAL